MFKKHILALFYDLVFPLLPVFIIYFLNLQITQYLSFFKLYGMVYLFLQIIVIYSSRANTLGYNLVGIVLKDSKKGIVNINKNILRMIVISLYLLTQYDLPNIDYIFLALFIIFVFPIPITYNNKKYYSYINMLLNLV